MTNRDDLLLFLKTHKAEFLEKYGVYKIGLFGSMAREGHLQANDIDIAIEMLPEKKNLRNFLSLKRFLENSLGVPVDLGIESSLKPASWATIRTEIIYV